VSEVTSETLHASCVAIGDYAVLITGASGSGKSDVALRLIDRGARLVSDDYTIIRRDGSVLYASPPETIQGKIEVRGIGIVTMPHVGNTPIAMLVELDSEVARMPEAGTARAIAGLMLSSMAAAPFEHSTPIKIELALRQRLGT
jgi:serine kinase of HPr protein (carbohydrate metabolism regulator)